MKKIYNYFLDYFTKSNSFNFSILLFFLYCFFTVVALFLFIKSSKSEFEDYYEGEIKNLQSQLSLRISKSKYEIDSLNSNILELKIESVNQKYIIDSLKSNENIIHSKYKKKYSEVSKYTPLNTLNYWTNKFEND